MMRWLSRMFRSRQQGELDCHEVAEVLQQHLDGELAPPTAAAVARHLDDCRRCGMEAETYEDLKERLGGLSTPVDEDAVRRLRDFVEELSEDA